MSQDETFIQRKNRLKQALQPEFDAALEDVAAAMARARDGALIEQTEQPLFDRINQLRQHAQEGGLQQRVDEAQAAFSPSGPPRPPAEQGHGPDQPPDP